MRGGAAIALKRDNCAPRFARSIHYRKLFTTQFQCSQAFARPIPRATCEVCIEVAFTARFGVTVSPRLLRSAPRLPHVSCGSPLGSERYDARHRALPLLAASGGGRPFRDPWPTTLGRSFRQEGLLPPGIPLRPRIEDGLLPGTYAGKGFGVFEAGVQPVTAGVPLRRGEAHRIGI